MANIAGITGLKNIIGNLAKEEAKMALKVTIGLKAAGLFLQGQSQRLVPVDTGNLKASAFTRATGVGFGTNVRVGYTAGYALFVHEAVGMVLKGQKRPTKGKYWDPQGRGQAKFLEEPSRTKRPEMYAIFKKIVSR